MVIIMKDKNYYINLLEKENMLDYSLYQHFDMRTFKKGDCLLSQGQTLEYLYILLEGRIKSCHSTSNGTSILNAFSQPITVLGEVEFLSGSDINNSVYAIEDTVCLRISVIQYKDLLINDFLFIRFLATTIACKLQSSNNNSSISINYPVENRLASYLIACHNHLIIEQNLIQVAEMIGCSYRQLQRTLNDFCQKKYIKKTGRSQFLILDFSTLELLGKDLYYI